MVFFFGSEIIEGDMRKENVVFFFGSEEIEGDMRKENVATNQRLERGGERG